MPVKKQEGEKSGWAMTNALKVKSSVHFPIWRNFQVEFQIGEISENIGQSTELFFDTTNCDHYNVYLRVKQLITSRHSFISVYNHHFWLLTKEYFFPSLWCNTCELNEIVSSEKIEFLNEYSTVGFFNLRTVVLIVR